MALPERIGLRSTPTVRGNLKRWRGPIRRKLPTVFDHLAGQDFVAVEVFDREAAAIAVRVAAHAADGLTAGDNGAEGFPVAADLEIFSVGGGSDQQHRCGGEKRSFHWSGVAPVGLPELAL